MEKSRIYTYLAMIQIQGHVHNDKALYLGDCKLSGTGKNMIIMINHFGAFDDYS